MSVLSELRRELNERQIAPKMTAVLADPVFDTTDGRIKRTAVSNKKASTSQAYDGNDSVLLMALAKERLQRSARSANRSPGDGLFPRLVFTRREAKAAASGSVNANEQARIQAGENARSRGIYRKKHNDKTK